MSELLAKVDLVAHSIELYEDELRVQLQLSPKYVIPLGDIVDLEFRRAWFFLSGKLIVIFKENGILQKMYMPFNFLAGECMEALVAILIERLADVYKNAGAIEFLSLADQGGEMVQCPHCSSMMMPGALVCPGCGNPRL
jgi:hypothetical protein